MKKLTYTLLLFFVTSMQLQQSLYSKETRSYEDDEDEISFFSLADDELPDLDESFLRQCAEVDPVDLITLLTDTVQIQNILEKQLYKHTNPPLIRSLTDDPVLQLARLTSCDCSSHLSVKLFFNQMRKVYFTTCSPYIESYLNFNGTDLVEELDRLSQLLGQEIDIPDVLPLFNKIKLEQRRIGAMLGFHRRTESFEWKMILPVYFLEHNFFLTDKERAAISNAPLFQNVSDVDDDDDSVEDFLTQHVVNDSFGIGDLRSDVIFDVVDTEKFTVTQGFEINLPTSIVLARGFFGKQFIDCPQQPAFSFLDLACLIETNKQAALHFGTNFAVNALRRLTEIAAQNDLGSKHAGFGWLTELNYHFDDVLSWQNKIRLFYLIPANEYRFFRPTKTPAEFNRDYANPADAVENLNFLSQQAVLFFYPPVVLAHVAPGVIVQYTPSLFMDYGCMKAELGYDYWHQAQESLRIVDYLQAPQQLDCIPGLKPSGTQHKVFATLAFNHSDSCYDWRLGIFGDATFASNGIGKDWTLGIDIGTRY